MSMKSHLLAALREQFNQWLTALDRLADEQVHRPLDASTNWTAKDVLAHVYAWQIRSNARFTAALNDATPEFPGWPRESSTDAINAWIYDTYHSLTWDEVFTRWKEGYTNLLTSAEAIAERDLLDSDRYAWLKGYSLADVLLGTYEHHQEHLEAIENLQSM